jgi:hypothetical protein
MMALIRSCEGHAVRLRERDRETSVGRSVLLLSRKGPNSSRRGRTWRVPARSADLWASTWLDTFLLSLPAGGEVEGCGGLAPAC